MCESALAPQEFHITTAMLEEAGCTILELKDGTKIAFSHSDFRVAFFDFPRPLRWKLAIQPKSYWRKVKFRVKAISQ